MKRSTPRRKRGSPKVRKQRSRLGATPQAPLVNHYSRRREYRRVFTDRLLITLQAGDPTLISVSLDQLMGNQNVIDWFDEYRIDRFELDIVDIKFPNEIPRVVVDSAVNLNNSQPSNSAEMLRMAELRRAFFNNVMFRPLNVLTVRSPQFDVTGGSNQFRRGFLSSNSPTDKWYGGVLHCEDSISFSADLRAEVSFRGGQ